MKSRIQVADLSAIETRVAGWLAQCKDLSDVFIPYTDVKGNFYRNGKDPYLSFAAKMFSESYDKLWADLQGWNGEESKLEAKRKRQIGKPGVLGAIYRLSGGGWGHAKKGYIDHGLDCRANEEYSQQNGKIKKIGKKYCGCPTIHDKIKTGLWGYAEAMGVQMSQEQAHTTVRMFRQAYKEIPEFWALLEKVVAEVLSGECTVRYVGPNDCVKIDKINIKDQGAILRMHLPSGRCLHYINARLEECKMPWKDQEGNDVYRPAIVYAGVDQETKQWVNWIQTHGGKVFENLVQAISRDILAVKLLMFEAAEIPVVGHVHDEGVGLVINDIFSPGVKEMVDMMSLPVWWAPGLLLGADGFESPFYHK